MTKWEWVKIKNTHTHMLLVCVWVSFEKLSTNWWMSGKIICACTLETITCFRSRSIIDSLHLTQRDFYLETLKWRNNVFYFFFFYCSICIFIFRRIFNEHAIYLPYSFFREENGIFDRNRISQIALNVMRLNLMVIWIGSNIRILKNNRVKNQI